MDMICPHCHRKIPNEAVFCGACGRRVVGWKGTPRRDASGGGRPVPTSAGDDTKRVRPNSELIRAAGGDPNATRKMSPDSDLLRVVRGEPEITSRVRPDTSLLEATAKDRDPEPASGPAADPDPKPAPAVRPPPRSPRPAPTSTDEHLVDTAYLMENALHRGRGRLATLMVADACMLAVGIYLIVSWALLPRARSSSDLAPTSSPGKHGYVDWQDRGEPARIATGPVHASFDAQRPDGGATAPRGRPAAGADAGTARRPPRPDRMAPEPRAREPRRPMGARPVMADRAAVEQAKRLAALITAQKAYLKAVPGHIRKRRKAIQDCYRQTLKLFNNVRGFVDIQFVVGPTGAVKSARASRNTTRSRTLGSCISGVFLSTVFPKPPGGGDVTLRYPFHFAPRKK